MPKQSSDVSADDQAQASQYNNLRADALRMWASAGSELTIATGAVSIASTQEGFFTVDTEGDAANDNLDTINGGETGEVIILHGAASGRLVQIRHNQGNILLASGENVVINADSLPIVLRYDGTNWHQVGESRIGVWGMSLGSGAAVLDGSEYGNIPYLPRVIPIGWYIEAPLESGSVTVDVKHSTFGGALSTAFSPSLTTAQTNSATLTPATYAAGSWHFDVNGAATDITLVSVVVIGVKY